MPPKRRKRGADDRDETGANEPSDVPAAAPEIPAAPSVDRTPQISCESISSTIERVSEYQVGDWTASDDISMLGHIWKVKKSRTRSADGKVQLAVFLWGPKNESPMWAIIANVRFTLINQEGGENLVKTAADVVYNHESESWGFRRFMPWESHNDVKAFVNADDTLTFEVLLTVKKVTGFRQLQSFDFETENPRHDLTIKIGGKKLYASRSILAAHSCMLDRMLYGQLKESKENEVELKEVDYGAFHACLYLIYPTHALQEIYDDDVPDLLKIADYLEMKTVMNKIEKHLIDSTAFTVSAKLKMSADFCLVDLQNHCLKSFKDVKSIQQLDESEEYKQFSEATKLALFEKIMKLKE